MARIVWTEETLEGVLDDGTPVKATCWYWAKDINVEMVSPYPGMRTGRHIMFLAPMTYTADEYWKKAGWDLVRTLVDRGRWIDAHPDEVDARRREAKRRIAIVKKYRAMLDAERKALKKSLKSGAVDRQTYQRKLTPVNKVDQKLELVAFEQEESNWLRNGIVEGMSFPVRPPRPSKCPGVKNVDVYLRDSALTSKRGTCWNLVLETHMPETEVVGLGLNPSTGEAQTIDAAAFSACLKRQGEDLPSLLLDAWREIARTDDRWCATIA